MHLKFCTEDNKRRVRNQFYLHYSSFQFIWSFYNNKFSHIFRKIARFSYNVPVRNANILRITYNLFTAFEKQKHMCVLDIFTDANLVGIRRIYREEYCFQLALNLHNT